MNRLAVLSMLAVLPGLGEMMSRTEREYAINHLDESAQLFFDSIAGLSEEQWVFKPARNRWSIAECAYHIAVSEDYLLRRAIVQAQNPPPEPTRPIVRVTDEEALERPADRNRKINAPAPLVPLNAVSSAKVKSLFRTSRSKTKEYVQTSKDDLRTNIAYSGSAGAHLDAYQRLLFISAHIRRHVAQIEEVKAHARFPRTKP